MLLHTFLEQTNTRVCTSIFPWLILFSFMFNSKEKMKIKKKHDAVLFFMVKTLFHDYSTNSCNNG